MQIGMIGLGRMGGNIVRRLMQHGHEAVVYDRDAKAVAALAATAQPAPRPGRAGAKLRPPRAVWVMLPAGKITEDDRPARQAARRRRHRDRRRQHVLARRHPPRQNAQGAQHPLCRCRHQRRRLGPRARLLHDDRRRQGDRRSPRSDFRRARARPRQCAAHAEARRPRSARRAGLYPRRSERRRPFRQDGPQRHRIRPDAGLCRRLRHPEECQQQIAARGRPLRSRSRRHRRGLAARQRHQFVAARPHGERARRRRQARRLRGVVEDSGEGRWTIMAAIEEAVPADVLSAALYTRFRSRQNHTFAEKILSAMRKGFGDHVEPKAKPIHDGNKRRRRGRPIRAAW